MGQKREWLDRLSDLLPIAFRRIPRHLSCILLISQALQTRKTITYATEESMKIGSDIWYKPPNELIDAANSPDELYTKE